MTTKEKLLSMVQPPEYKSKIKLYCNLSPFNLQRTKEITTFAENVIEIKEVK